MNGMAEWEIANGRYLAASLEWLRLRLERLADVGGVNDGQLAASAGARERSAEMESMPALLLLSRRIGLSEFERDVLLLCAGMELDTRIAGLCAAAQRDAARPYPTFALALALFEGPAWDALSPERPLRYWRMLDIHQPGAQPLTASALRADERIVSYLKGLNYLDDRVTPLVAPFEHRELNDRLPLSQQKVADDIVAELQRAEREGRSPVVQLVGSDSLAKQLVARQAATQVGLTLIRLPAALLPQQAGDIETLARLWRRESLLLPLGLYLDTDETAGPGGAESHAAVLHRLLCRDLGATFVATREVQPGLGVGAVSVDVPKPTRTEQAKAWQRVLGPEAGDGAAILAAQFDLNVPTINAISETALGEAEGALPDRVWRGCVSRTRPRLQQLAQRIESNAGWADIVLPAEPLALLHEISAHARQRLCVYEDWGFRAQSSRGLGINALFAGESGTGKTRAAEILANDLHLDLWRIDISSVTSKYIGETEKNLRLLFDAAEDSGAILFFDEADALFGKRSEVKDSHDRYSNIQIDFLLVRAETFGGVCILATNQKSAIDQAFLRRLRFIVNFPFPGVAERRLIWERAFPQRTPVERRDPNTMLDLDWLARLNLTGGSIHNIAVHSAFRAAAAPVKDRKVTMPMVLEAARTELRKLEKPVSDADFRWQPKASTGRQAVTV